LGVTKLFNKYLIRRQVFPTLPSPTTTSLIAIGSYDIKLIIKVISSSNILTIIFSFVNNNDNKLCI
jgi:hypothetical protein